MAIFGKKEVCLLIKGQFRYTIAKTGEIALKTLCKVCFLIKGQFRYTIAKTGEIARKTLCKVVKKFEGKKLYNHEMSHVSCRCL